MLKDISEKDKSAAFCRYNPTSIRTGGRQQRQTRLTGYNEDLGFFSFFALRPECKKETVLKKIFK
ncbi:MAG: hypothetical protein IJH36_03335 [Clostridia bacterium]|nr:hypothetical protein [Clostridia bacterium]